MDQRMEERLREIKLICLDVDGVMTDGRIFWTENGDARAFDVKDGLGIVAAQRLGIVVAVISGKYSEVVTKRIHELNIHFAFQDVKDKAAIVDQILKETNIKPEQAAHIGDDVVDIAAYNRVGFKVAVADAHPEVLSRADYVTRARGGRGAVREFIDLVVRSQGKWREMMEIYGV